MQSKIASLLEGKSINEIKLVHEQYQEKIKTLTRGSNVKDHKDLGLLVTLQGLARSKMGGVLDVEHCIGHIYFEIPGEFILEYCLNSVSYLNTPKIKLQAASLEEAMEASKLAMEIMAAENMQKYQPEEDE